VSDKTLNSNVADFATGQRRRRRAVLYLRVSTPGQVQTDYDPEGISIPAQREAGKSKADSLDADVVREFVEPGRTATSIDKRPAFQEMVAWVKSQKDIDYVIVYHFNRVFRNSVDAAITKRDLKKVGARIVSTVLDMGDTPESAMVESIIHAVDQYQSQASGADIKYKMAQKIKNGGSVGVAKLGYLNVREPKPEGGEIRTIALDPERAPLVRLAFELYATGDYTLADLADELYDRGLRTRTTKRHPAQQVSINKLSVMLRDRYYIGYVTFQGEEVKGRHEALIDDVLFEQVQTVIDSRAAAKERRRIHHHYLKGSILCGRCKSRGIVQRLTTQHTVNSRGSEYLYLFCGNTQDGTCQAPHYNVIRVEDAVEAHYATVRFTPEFITDVRTHIAQALDDEQAASRLLTQQLTTELRRLDTNEENLIDLAADKALPQEKIKKKLAEITRQRQRLTDRLAETDGDLAASAQLAEVCLKLLENPQELYRRCSDEQRRLLNQAIFHGLYIDDDQITDHDLREPFAHLHAIQAARQGNEHPPPEPENRDTGSHNSSRAAPQPRNGPTALSGFDALLAGMDLVHCSIKPSGVELRGIEPLTFSMRTRRATNCATAP
jgi:site-specific DNA recombinase